MPVPESMPHGATGTLTASQRRYLRGLCHHLHPVIMLGTKGVTAAVTGELRKALAHHELVKIRLSGGDHAERRRQIQTLLDATGAELVQEIGHTASLFLRNDDAPKLALPR